MLPSGFFFKENSRGWKQMNYNNIGKIAASHGLAGEVVLRHALGKRTSLNGLAAIFIEMRKDDLLPYFIQEARIKNESEIYLKLEGVDKREQALLLTQKPVWLTQ